MTQRHLALKERFEQMPWPQQLGNLASTLNRMASRATSPAYDTLVTRLLREAALFIEWSAPHVPPELLPELAAMQREVLAWCRLWPLDPARPLLTLRGQQMADALLRYAGLVPSSSSDDR